MIYSRSLGVCGDWGKERSKRERRRVRRGKRRREERGGRESEGRRGDGEEEERKQEREIKSFVALSLYHYKLIKS